MRRRKNFLPSFILAIFFWIICLFILIFISPNSNLAIFSFLFILFCSLFLTLALFLANTRRGFLFALGAVLFLILKWQKLAHVLNNLLLMAAILVLEIYFTKRE
jgi:hypothetical protein